VQNYIMLLLNFVHF